MKPYSILKAFADVLIAVVVLIIVLPVIIIVALRLAYVNKGKVWFIQDRPGLNGKIFRLIKFKTMTDQRDAAGNLLPDAKRLTATGRWVRSTSLDELPQLINVVKGDMSFVGPRPLLVKYLPLYNEHQKQRHLVKPGITGWAQVNGRNAISWEQKFDYDVWYAKNQHFLLDIRILWLTVLKTIKKEGINASDAATMKPFEGTKQ